MFDIWHKIMEEGEVAIPASPSELSALEWCEVALLHRAYYKDMWQECEEKREER